MTSECLAHQVDLVYAGHEDQGGLVLLGGKPCHAAPEFAVPGRASREWLVGHVERVGHRLCGMNRRASHELGEALGVDSRGHGDDAEILTELGQFEAHSEDQVGIELALVDLIYGNSSHSFEFRIAQQAAQQHAGRDEFDVLALAGITAYRIADALAGQLLKAVGRRTYRHATRRGDENLAAARRLVGQGRRNERGLTRARRGLDHHVALGRK